MRSIVAVIPLYNGARYIEESLRSVLAQDRPADEIIIVDDGSQDNGWDLVQSLYPSHPVIKLVKKTNGGQGSARNLGVRSSSSDLIAFLDQDDVWYPSHLRLLAEPFEQSQDNLGWSYSNLDEIDVQGGMVRHSVLDFYPNEHPKRSLQSCLQQDMHILPSASLVSRTAFDAVGGFDERLIGYEDDDLFLRIFRAGFKNKFIDQPLSKWRMHSTSTSFSRVMGESRLTYFHKLISAYPDDPGMMRFNVRDLIAPRFTKLALGDLIVAILCKNREKAQFAIAQIREFSVPLRKRRRIQIRWATALLSSAACQAVYRMTPGFIVRRVHAALRV